MIDTIIIRDVRGRADTLMMLAQKYAPQINVVATLSYTAAEVRQIETLKPTLVIMDLNMPSHDNFMLFEALEYRNFFLVYSTAHIGDGRKIPCCGVDYLLKPLDKSEFVSLVQSILQRLPFRKWSPAIRPAKNVSNAFRSTPPLMPVTYLHRQV
jgi:two-component system, LytTR family, response regulator